MINIEMTKREASLLFGLIKLAFEMQVERKFDMSNESLIEISRVWEDIAEKVDALNGIKKV